MMATTRIKPLMPSLREKKRYIAYEVISNTKFNGPKEPGKAILDAGKDFLGSFGMAKLGMMPIEEQWNPDTQRGMIRVNHNHSQEARASMMLVQNINGHEALIKSIGASGMIKKTHDKYLR